MTLRNVGVGQTVTVSKITGVGAIKRRIMDMGLTKGTSVYVRKVAPLGDPIEQSEDMSCLCVKLTQS